ncbi:hypothetical protein ACEW7V_00285 [Areca yellow leaf disease phytoplasma]|uniref:hypothetical protein n=1 Tax=Areca yellow leaf disease phytoplasma TaxID=927614 RepID=UPI0035B501C7
MNFLGIILLKEDNILSALYSWEKENKPFTMITKIIEIQMAASLGLITKIINAAIHNKKK